MFLPVDVQTVDEAIKRDPSIEAIYITSPTYDGLCADLKGIKKVIGDRVLVVDEAHGGACYFNPYMKHNAMNSGADMSMISSAKSLGGINALSFVLTNKNSKISKNKVTNAYKLLATTSRSWVLYTDLEGIIC